MNRHLPRILCLHGSGSSAAIFKVQLRRIVRSFDDQFEFVFAQGPFECGIGAGMHPTFTHSGPFYRWHCSEAKTDHTGITAEAAEKERRIVRDYLGCLLQDSNAAPFVGVIAFSHGCAIATNLILEQHELGKLWGRCLTFQFAILFCSTYPPTTLISSERGKERFSQAKRLLIAK